MKRLLTFVTALWLPLTAHAAGEIQVVEPTLTGQTLYYVLFSGPGEADAGEAWDGNSWETFTDTRDTWDIAMTETAATGQFLGDLPAINRKIIRWQIYQDADDNGTPNHASDILLYEGDGEWSGTRFIVAADVTHWNATAIPGVDTAGYPKVTIKDGTGTGEIDTASGAVPITETTIEMDEATLVAIGESVWDVALPGTYAAGTAGKIVGDNINAAIDSRASQASLNTLDDYVDTEVADILDDTGTSGVQIPADEITAAAIATGAIDDDAIAASAIGPSELATDAIGSDELAAAGLTEIEDEVWDALMADHLDALTIGASLNAAGSAGDPWATALPGGYGAGTAGFILGTNLDATVSEIKTKTDYLPSVAAGANGGVLIAGSNAATTFATLTSTGAFSINGVSNVAQTGDSFAAIGSGITLSAAGIDAIWNEDLSTGHSTPGSLPTLLPDSGDQIAGEDAVIAVDAGAIADAVWDETTSEHTSVGKFGETLNWLKAAFTSSGVYSTPALANASADLTQEQIDDIAAAVSLEVGSIELTDVDQESVPTSRTFILTRDAAGGLVAEAGKGIATGENNTFAVDFKNDIPVNGRIVTVNTPTISAGTAGGITFAAEDIGRDKTLAKFRPTGVTAGDYTVQVGVIYDSGATAIGTVEFTVAE